MQMISTTSLNGCVCVRQTIKTWYKLMPDALGKKLAKRHGRGGAMDEEARQEREQQTEEEYLRKEGFTEEEVEEFVAQDDNPIVTGVY